MGAVRLTRFTCDACGKVAESTPVPVDQAPQRFITVSDTDSQQTINAGTGAIVTNVQAVSYTPSQAPNVPDGWRSLRLDRTQASPQHPGASREPVSLTICADCDLMFTGRTNKLRNVGEELATVALARRKVREELETTERALALLRADMRTAEVTSVRGKFVRLRLELVEPDYPRRPTEGSTVKVVLPEVV